MSAHIPLTIPRVSAQGARKREEINLLARFLAVVHRNAAAVLKAMVARRSSTSIRKDVPWDVGMDHLAEQASPPWVPRGW